MTESLKSRTIIIDGYKFVKDTKTGYYLCSRNINGSRPRLHNYIWQKYNGLIPKGFHIHHIDGNKDNNDISNLIAISAQDHESYHFSKRIKENPEWFKDVHEKGVESAAKWHGSKKGREWHLEHYQKTKDQLHTEHTVKCANCGKEYVAKNVQGKFCSGKCKSAWRRKKHLDDVKRKCDYCGKEFTTNKYKRAKFCSKSCARKSYWLSKSDES